jgi:hypothetical protein
MGGKDMGGKDMGGQSRRHANGRIRAFRVEEIAARAEAKVAAFGSFGATGAEARALRAERRAKGGTGYDLLRHLGLVRRMRQLSPASAQAASRG